MTYTWHDIDGRMADLCDECGFDDRELTGSEDEAARLDAAYADLERLLDHPDAGRRPAPETWSAREYVDHCVEVAGCRRVFADVVPAFTTAQRAEVLPDTYPQPVTVEWLVRHLLHDTEHHVLDVRRGYARLAMGDFPEVPFRG